MGNSQTIKNKYHHTTLSFNCRYYDFGVSYYKYTLMTNGKTCDIITQKGNVKPLMFLTECTPYKVNVSIGSFHNTYTVASSEDRQTYRTRTRIRMRMK